MRNLCFASRVGEIRLERLSNSRGAAIKDLSRKTSEAVQGEAAAGFFSKAESKKKANAKKDKNGNKLRSFKI